MRLKITQLLTEFLESEQSSGILLVLCAFASILAANSLFGETYVDFWHAKLGFELGEFTLKLTIEQWINDGLMAIFFLLTGLEIRRELYAGELSDLQNASLPIFGALGGMALPALIHFLFNRGAVTQSGFGIPMATDIAFSLGVMALLGKRAPLSLKLFLTALAIMDDLGAILVIAIFYTSNVSFLYLGLALAIFLGLMLLNWLGVRHLVFYLIPGLFMWFCMLQSGVHATLAGVLLAFAIPFVNGSEKSPSHKLEHFLDKPVAYMIVPIFALANTSLVLAGNWLSGLVSSNSVGILAGLVIGKPLGIFALSFLAVRLGLSQLPEDVSWRHIFGAGLLGGIGFTMSIFITVLAFDSPVLVQDSKIAILLASLLAGSAGFLFLRSNSSFAPDSDPHR